MNLEFYNKKLKEGKVAYDPSKRARKEAVLDQIRDQEGLFEIKNIHCISSKLLCRK